MSPESYANWLTLVSEVDTESIPTEFIKKIIVKLKKRKQHTINVSKLFEQQLDSDEVEEIVARIMQDLGEDNIVSISFDLNVEIIADVVQTETDKLLQTL